MSLAWKALIFLFIVAQFCDARPPTKAARSKAGGATRRKPKTLLEFDEEADSFYDDDSFSRYWQRKVTREGDRELHSSPLSYSTDDHTWYYDGISTCIGWGYFDDDCDSERLVCAGGDTYGYGTEQIALLNELLEHLPRARHFMCPVCVNEPLDDDFANVCDAEGRLVEIEKEIVARDPDLYLIPGEMAPFPMGTFVDCFCEFHHTGESLDDGTYWRAIVGRNDLNAERLTHYDGAWYYTEVYTCVGMGNCSSPCDNTKVYCAGTDGACFGSAEQQMNAIHEAVDNAGWHPGCPDEY